MKTALQNILIGFALLCAGAALNACTEDIPDQILVPVRTDTSANNDQKETTDAPAVPEQPSETTEIPADPEQLGEVTETSADPEQPTDDPETPTELESQEGVGDVPDDVPVVSEEPTVPEEPTIPEESTVPEIPTIPERPSNVAMTYTLTVKASKNAGADTRALKEGEGGVLNSEWTANADKVKVYYGTEVLGELTAAESGISTTFSGVITTTTEIVGNELTLKYQTADKYSNQDGTLEYIADNCDHSIAIVTVTSQEGNDLTTTNAVFVNQQSISKFTLKSGNDELNASAVTISDGTNSYNITLSQATSVFYVALPGFTGTFTLVANDGTSTYKFEHTATFENSKYYVVDIPLTLVSFGRNSYGGATSL